MKRFLWCGVLFLLYTSLWAVEVEIPYRDIPDNVALIKIYQVDDSKSQVPTKQIKYNLLGDKEFERIYNAKGEPKWTVYYEYRDNGQISQKQAESPRGEFLWGTDYIYDQKGRIKREINQNSKGNPDYTVVHEYQDDRNEVLAYDSAGSLQWRKKIIEPKDRPVREVYYYYPDGSRIKGIVEEYNSVGNIDNETHIDEIGTVFRRIKTEYDPFGRVIGRTVYDHRGKVQRRVWIEFMPHGHIGLVRQVIPTEGRVEEFTYSYKIDQRGSWIYRHEVVTITEDNMDEPIVRTSTQVREIEYHSTHESDNG
ncbi:MAG: hypothetical protein R6V86_06500 [Spirochaetia bacterium]